MDSAGYITPEEVRRAMRRLHSEDLETDIGKALRHAFADDLKPVDAQGRSKPSPLVILIGFLLCALLGVFLYFSLGRNL
jgi:hypothetical protein